MLSLCFVSKSEFVLTFKRNILDEYISTDLRIGTVDIKLFGNGSKSECILHRSSISHF